MSDVNIEAVIFDMDGLLIDSEPLWKIAEIEAFAKVGIDLTTTDCEETVGLRMDEVVKLWYDRVGWEGKSLKAVEEDVIDIVIREIKSQGTALEGVYEILESLSTEEVKIGLATSSAMRIVDAVLEKLDIRTCFDALHSAENEIFGKPHPAVFINCAKSLGVPPTNCLVFEDSLNGVIAAKAARMNVIAIPEKSHEYNEKLILADKILPSLNGFKFGETL